MDVVADAVLVEELVELLIVHAMRALDLAIEVRRARTNIHVADVEPFEMPVKRRLELGAVVRLYDVHPEREPTDHFVDELRGRALIAGVVDLEDADPRAVINRCELIQAA